MSNQERDFRKRKCVLAVILPVCLILAAGCGRTRIPDGSNGRTEIPDGSNGGTGIPDDSNAGTGIPDSSNGRTGTPEAVDDGVEKREGPAEAVERIQLAHELETEEILQIDIGFIPVIVEKGDSLWKISERYYGDGKYWGQIYEYNQSVIGENPSLIYEGTELIFPYMD